MSRGWVAEWSNAHAWKACLPQGNQGSNPCPSARRPRALISLSIFLAVPALLCAEPLQENALTVAQREFQEGQLAAAASALQGAGDSARALDLQGLILAEQGKSSEAIERFQAAHAKDRATFAQLHVGDALRRQGKWAEAREAYRAAAKETNILATNERLRYGIFLTSLGEKNEAEAKEALGQIPFPTQTAGFYYAQAAWSYTHGNKSEAEKWLARAHEIFPEKHLRWYERTLFDFGWRKTKPVLTTD